MLWLFVGSDLGLDTFISGEMCGAPHPPVLSFFFQHSFLSISPLETVIFFLSFLWKASSLARVPFWFLFAV